MQQVSENDLCADDVGWRWKRLSAASPCRRPSQAFAGQGGSAGLQQQRGQVSPAGSFDFLSNAAETARPPAGWRHILNRLLFSLVNHPFSAKGNMMTGPENQAMGAGTRRNHRQADQHELEVLWKTADALGLRCYLRWRLLGQLRQATQREISRNLGVSLGKIAAAPPPEVWLKTFPGCSNDSTPISNNVPNRPHLPAQLRQWIFHE